MNQTEMLKKLEWETVYGMNGREIRRCPECKSLHLDDHPNQSFKDHYVKGRGHAEDCELNRLITCETGDASDESHP